MAIRKLQVINAPTNPNIHVADTIKHGFKSLEKKIETLIEGPKVPKATIWASVAAAAVQAPRMAPQARPAVRVRIPEAANKSAAELLATVKPIIQGAYAVRQLRSGDVEVAVPDQRAKDQALN